jgi:hypothetical protein
MQIMHVIFQVGDGLDVSQQLRLRDTDLSCAFGSMKQLFWFGPNFLPMLATLDSTRNVLVIAENDDCAARLNDRVVGDVITKGEQITDLLCDSSPLR